MTPRLAWLLLGAAALVGLLALAVALGRGRDRERAPRDSGAAASDAAAATSDAEPAGPRLVSLYFPGPDGRLIREQREVPGSADPSRLAGNVVQALLDGPRSSHSFRVLPEGVTLGEVHLGGDGIAYVDLVSTANPEPPVEGSTGELLTVYSLVNSVVENVPGARSLVLLWNGRQPRTLGGHIDTSRPLLPAPDLAAS